MGTVLHLNRTGPTVISDEGLITRVGFAALCSQKANLLLISYSNTLCELHHYADNSSIIQKLIYY
jgi:hypothetical protein